MKVSIKMEQLETEKEFVGMANCFYCNKPKHILLDRRLKKSLPREAVYDNEPCDDCKGLMEKGVIFISVKDGEKGGNPYRTGGWWVIKEEAVRRMLKGKLLENVLKKRICFIDDSTCDKIGLEKAKEPK